LVYTYCATETTGTFNHELTSIARAVRVVEALTWVYVVVGGGGLLIVVLWVGGCVRSITRVDL